MTIDIFTAKNKKKVTVRPKDKSDENLSLCLNAENKQKIIMAT
jgi:hypothetical protein